MKNYAMLLLLAAATPTLALGAPAGFNGAVYLAHAKISPATARATVLAREPGTITDQELEKEPGGSGLRYSFDVTTKTGRHEVGIDAITGKVLEDSIDSGND